MNWPFLSSSRSKLALDSQKTEIAYNVSEGTIMRAILTLLESVRSLNGIAIQYEVSGMPRGYQALINNFGFPAKKDWRIRSIQPDGMDTGWRGKYADPAAALADIQDQIETVK